MVDFVAQPAPIVAPLERLLLLIKVNAPGEVVLKFEKLELASPEKANMTIASFVEVVVTIPVDEEPVLTIVELVNILIPLLE